MFFDWSILPSGVETMFLLSSICRVELGPFLVNLFSIVFNSYFLDWIFLMFYNQEAMLYVLNKSCNTHSWNCCKINWHSPYYVIVAVVEFLTRVTNLWGFFMTQMYYVRNHFQIFWNVQSQWFRFYWSSYLTVMSWVPRL